MFGKDELAEKLIAFLESLGIDPIYGLTIIAIGFSLSNYKDLRNWENIKPEWRKGLIKSTLFATMLALMMSLLRFFGLL